MRVAVGRGGGMLSSHGDAGTSAGSAYSGASFASMLSTSRIKPFMLKKTLPVAPPFAVVVVLVLVRFTCCTISSARQLAARFPIDGCAESETRCSPLPIHRLRRCTFCDAHQSRRTG